MVGQEFIARSRADDGRSRSETAAGGTTIDLTSGFCRRFDLISGGESKAGGPLPSSKPEEHFQVCSYGLPEIFVMRSAAWAEGFPLLSMAGCPSSCGCLVLEIVNAGWSGSSRL